MASHSMPGGRILEGEFQLKFSFFKCLHKKNLSEKQLAQKVFKAQLPLNSSGAIHTLVTFRTEQASAGEDT